MCWQRIRPVPIIGGGSKVPVATLEPKRTTMTSFTRESATEAVPLDTIFRTLSHPTRRSILTTLREKDLRHSGGIPVAELAPDESPNDTFHIRLYHQHLPKLDTVGFIDWNPSTETILPGPHYEAIESVVALLEGNQDELPAAWP